MGLVAVFIGGGFGSLLRYLGIEAVKRAHGSAFPLGTMLVNVFGSLLIGMVMAWVLRDADAREPVRMLLVTGVLGGFTTFSAFSWDVLVLWQRGEVVQALAYVLGSVVLSVIAATIGFMVMGKFA